MENQNQLQERDAETLVAAGCSITLTDGVPCFSFTLKSGENGIPFDYVNFNSLLISAAQALADAYAEIGRAGIDKNLQEIRTRFEKKVLLPLKID